MSSSRALKPYVIHGLRVSLVKEPGVKLAERPEMRNAASAARVFADYFAGTDREEFAVAVLTVRHRVVGINTVSVGSLTQTLVHPREVFKPAILGGGAAVLIAHTHPSGDPEPSPEDVSLTRRLVSAGGVLGIDVLDHLVIGEDDRFVSFRERGLM